MNFFIRVITVYEWSSDLIIKYLYNDVTKRTSLKHVHISELHNVDKSIFI